MVCMEAKLELNYIFYGGRLFLFQKLDYNVVPLSGSHAEWETVLKQGSDGGEEVVATEHPDCTYLCPEWPSWRRDKTSWRMGSVIVV